MIHIEEKGDIKKSSDSWGGTQKLRKAGHRTGEFKGGHEPDPIYPSILEKGNSQGSNSSSLLSSYYEL